MQWQTTDKVNVLRKRAAIVQAIRAFFLKKDILEVETPCLSRHTVTDPFMHALSCEHNEPGSKQTTKLYLQTSPEYAMKRLLAAGSGDIFQISKAFRNDEVGRLHNPEFSMLEWYRLGFSMQELIDEVADLIKQILLIETIQQATYSALFEQYLQFNPISIHINELIKVAINCGLQSYVQSMQEYQGKVSQFDKGINEQPLHNNSQNLLKDNLLQVLFSQEIEPHIGQQCPIAVSHFPASQASLACLSLDQKTAHRFEFYYKGIELANGFEELSDANIQMARFKQDNQKRLNLGLSPQTLDTNFLASLQHGLPQCSGVALGIDRLIMLALNKHSIADVLSFTYENA